VKIWTTVNWAGAGTEDDPRRPDLPAGVAYAAVEVPPSTPTESSYCFAKVAGTLATVSAISSITDSQAAELCSSLGLTLRSLDVADPELVTLGDSLGVDVRELRKWLRGTLQEREWEVIRALAAKKGVDVSAYEFGIKEGKCEPFEAALQLLR